MMYSQLRHSYWIDKIINVLSRVTIRTNCKGRSGGVQTICVDCFAVVLMATDYYWADSSILNALAKTKREPTYKK